MKSPSKRRQPAVSVIACLVVAGLGLGGLALWLSGTDDRSTESPVERLALETGPSGQDAAESNGAASNEAAKSARSPRESGQAEQRDQSLAVEALDNSGSPVALALVILECSEEDSGEDSVYDSCRTGVDGRALFDRWPTAPFRVIVTPKEEDGDQAPLLDAERAVDPTKVDQRVPVRIELSRAARIVGALDCSDGSSPRSSGVDIFHVATRSWTNAAAVEDGRFTSQWMAPGEVIVYARNGTWTETDLRLRQRFTLAEGRSHGFHGTLEPALVLEGTTVDGLGRPAPGHTVLAVEVENPGNERSATSDEEGRFRIEGLHATDYAVGLLADGETRQRIRLQRGAAPTEAAPLVVRP